MIVIVGGGLSGLACGVELARAGRPFLILEASDAVGGRVRSDLHDGFVLDRGFQVVLTSYSHVARYVDIESLRPRFFDSGAVISGEPLRHPGFHPGHAGHLLQSTALTWTDRLRLGVLSAQAVATPDETLLAGAASTRDRTTEEELAGFSAQFTEAFFRPFFGGVLLDDSLATSAALFRYYLKKFTTGRAWVPAGGMGALSQALAANLPPGSIRLRSRVYALERAGDHVSAVILEDGARIACESVVLALDEPSRCRLLGGVPRPSRSVAAVYFETSQPLPTGKLIVLAPGRTRAVRHFVQITNIAPEYASDGRHLLSATVLEPRRFPPGELTQRAAAEIRELYPNLELHALGVVEVPHAVPAQPPGFGNASLLPSGNIWLAGDGAQGASIEAALASGRRVAEALA